MKIIPERIIKDCNDCPNKYDWNASHGCEADYSTGGVTENSMKKCPLEDAPEKPHMMIKSRNGLMANLKYIAESPSPEYGGFHPQVVETAKKAIEEIETLKYTIKILLDLKELEANRDR